MGEKERGEEGEEREIKSELERRGGGKNTERERLD